MFAGMPEEVSDSAQPIQPGGASRTHIRRLGRDALFYSLPTILSGVVSFVMLPIYTKYLTPADYGLLSILDLSLEIALLLFSAGATAGLMRFYFKAQDPIERNRVLFTAWASATGLYAIGSVLLFAVAPIIWTHGLNGAGSLSMVHLAAVNFTISSLTSFRCRCLPSSSVRWRLQRFSPSGCSSR